MQGFKTFVLLAVVVALLGLARAAPADDEPTGLEQLVKFDGLEKEPEMPVRFDLTELSTPEARCGGCTACVCRTVCRALGFRYSACVSATVCRCRN